MERVQKRRGKKVLQLVLFFSFLRIGFYGQMFLKLKFMSSGIEILGYFFVNWTPIRVKQIPHPSVYKEALKLNQKERKIKFDTFSFIRVSVSLII